LRAQSAHGDQWLQVHFSGYGIPLAHKASAEVDREWGRASVAYTNK